MLPAVTASNHLILEVLAMPHRWLKIAVGRVCIQCSLAEAHGEFTDDKNPCPQDNPYLDPKVSGEKDTEGDEATD